MNWCLLETRDGPTDRWTDRASYTVALTNETGRLHSRRSQRLFTACLLHSLHHPSDLFLTYLLNLPVLGLKTVQRTEGQTKKTDKRTDRQTDGRL